MATFIRTAALLFITYFFAHILVLAEPVPDDVAIERRQSVPSTLPSPWTSLGCYTDVASARTLGATSYVSYTNMTVESCIAFCGSAGYNYAGVEYARECYCDWTLQYTGAPTAISDCHMPCTGKSTESCGAGNRINIYYNGAPPPTIQQVVGGWEYIGCWTDNNPQLRTLIRQYDIPGGATNELCVKTCNIGWVVAGVEYGTECHCSGGLYPSTRVPDSECSMACNANTSEWCGGRNRINVWKIPGSNPLPHR